MLQKGYTRVATSVLGTTDLDWSAKLLYIFLRSRCRSERGFCWPSYPLLVRDTAFSEWEIRQQIEALKAAQLIEVEPPERGKKRSNTYRLPDLAPPYLRVPNWFLWHATHSSRQKAVGIWIISHTNRRVLDCRWSQVGQMQLAKELGLSRRQVQGDLDALVRNGALERQRPDRQHAALYSLLSPEGEQLPDPLVEGVATTDRLPRSTDARGGQVAASTVHQAPEDSKGLSANLKPLGAQGPQADAHRIERDSVPESALPACNGVHPTNTDGKPERPASEGASSRRSITTSIRRGEHSSRIEEVLTLVDGLPNDLRSFWSERCAIREFDGNLDREAAELGAWFDLCAIVEEKNTSDELQTRAVAVAV